MNALELMSHELQRIMGWNLTIPETARRIRQVHASVGCFHKCTHCFANTSTVIRQMELKSFILMIAEISKALAGSPFPNPMLFLGAESDPSAISGFAEYAAVWLRELPVAQPIRIFTHGWVLTNELQRSELRSVLKVYHRYKHRITVQAISIDPFCEYARVNWQGYANNIKKNLQALLEVLPPHKVKLQVKYGVDRYCCSERTTIGYWRARYLSGGKVDAALDILASAAADDSCARITLATIEAGIASGLSIEETLQISRDSGTPFYSGRAARLYVGVNKQTKEEANRKHRDTDLRKLIDERESTLGISIYPDGKARIVDCYRYRLGPWLNGGLPMFPDVVSTRREDSPWRRSDLLAPA